MLSERFAANTQLLNRLEGDLSCGRFPHAVMLTGESGSGKKYLARLLAAALVCSQSDKPCGACRDCKKAFADSHPDIQYFGGAGSSFKKEDIERLREQVYLSPNEAENKVFVLDGVRDLTSNAANSLLKVLEEPPENTYLILISNNRRDVLPTVLSRVVEFNLTLPTPEQAAPYVEKLAGVDRTAALEAAQRFGGNIGRAVQMLTSPQEGEIAGFIDGVLGLQAKRDVFGLTVLLLTQVKTERRQLKQLLARLYEQYSRIVASRAQGARFGGVQYDIPLSAALSSCEAVRKANEYLSSNAPAQTVLVWLAAELKI